MHLHPMIFVSRLDKLLLCIQGKYVLNMKIIYEDTV